MNARSLRFLATTIASLLAAPVFAVTDTWDGGGADNNISTNNNWADNTEPASDLINTDLIFIETIVVRDNTALTAAPSRFLRLKVTNP